MQALLAHVGVRLPYKPTKSARERVNKVLALPARPEPPEALGCGFSASQYEAVAALRLRLEKSLETPVTLRIAVGSRTGSPVRTRQEAATPASPVTSRETSDSA